MALDMPDYVINRGTFNPRYKQRKRMRSMLRRHGTHCSYCKGEMTTKRGFNHPMAPSRDHVIPLCRGGYDHLSNIVMACRWCNERKGPLTGDEFIAWLEGRASRLDYGIGHPSTTLVPR